MWRSLAAAAILTAPMPAAAEPMRMPEAELAEVRGGYASPLGDLGFAASIRTFVDGTLALETRMVLGDSGFRTERVTDAGLPGVVIIPALGGDFQAPPGASAILHDLGADRIASVVINRASDRTIRQETNLTLYLPQLPDLQQQLAAARMAGTVADAAAGALR